MSCPIVSTMKQVTQGSIIPQRMNINSILIHITEIIDHDHPAASCAQREAHLAGYIKQIYKGFYLRTHFILSRAALPCFRDPEIYIT